MISSGSHYRLVPIPHSPLALRGTRLGVREMHVHVTTITITRVSNRKYESMQNQSTAVFPSRSTIGKIETVPQMGMTLKCSRQMRY